MSAWMTSEMSSTWMPRAATSVATSTFTRPLGEALEVARALGLVQVAVQADRGDALVGELLRQLLGERAGAREHEGAAVALGELGHDRALVALLDEQHLVVDRAGRLVLTRDLVHGRVDEELVDELGDALVERSRRRAARWPPSFVMRRMRCTGSRNPRSHMWSASSSTTMATWDRSR